MVFARILAGLCRIWRCSLTMEGLQIALRRTKIVSRRVQKSSSDRSGDAQEQPKSPEDTQFRIFGGIFANFWKKLKPQSSPRSPKSAQEHPKSAPRAAQECPGVPQESPWRPPEAPKSAQVEPNRHPRGPKLLSESAATTSGSATRSRSAFGAKFG